MAPFVPGGDAEFYAAALGISEDTTHAYLGLGTAGRNRLGIRTGDDVQMIYTKAACEACPVPTR
jgi:hypothetical protein